MRPTENKFLLTLFGATFFATEVPAAVELEIDVLESNEFALLVGWADDVVHFKRERSQYLLY